MPFENYRRTKIISTIGPSSDNPEKIGELIQAGADVFRLNFSHGNHGDHKKNIEMIREVSHKLKKSCWYFIRSPRSQNTYRKSS